MRDIVTNRDIAIRISDKISTSSPTEERCLSSFMELSNDIKIDVLEAVAIAQIDHIAESMIESNPVISMLRIGRFTISKGTMIGTIEKNKQSYLLYNKSYKELDYDQKVHVKSVCKPIITEKCTKLDKEHKASFKNINNVVLNTVNIFSKRCKSK